MPCPLRVQLQVCSFVSTSPLSVNNALAYTCDELQRLRALDRDGDGTLDINELYDFMKEYEKEHSKVATLKWLTVALSVFAMLLCVANIGTSWVAVTLSKEIRVNEDCLSLNENNGHLNGNDLYEEVSTLDDGVVGDESWAHEALEWYQNSTNYNETEGEMRNRRLKNRNKHTFEIHHEKFDDIMSNFCKGGSWKDLKHYNMKKCHHIKNCKFAKSRAFLKCNNKKVFLEEHPHGLSPKGCKEQRSENNEYMAKFRFQEEKNGNEVNIICFSQKDTACQVHGLKGCDDWGTNSY